MRPVFETNVVIHAANRWKVARQTYSGCAGPFAYAKSSDAWHDRRNDSVSPGHVTYTPSVNLVLS